MHKRPVKIAWQPVSSTKVIELEIEGCFALKRHEHVCYHRRVLAVGLHGLEYCKKSYVATHVPTGRTLGAAFTRQGDVDAFVRVLEEQGDWGFGEFGDKPEVPDALKTLFERERAKYPSL